MLETPEDMARLQQVLDDSYRTAGPHLRAVITPERRLHARAVCEQLTGMRLLVVATVSRAGQPIGGPVDGIFYRGAFHFGSSPKSLRMRHLRRTPHVTATHLQGEELSITVHGRATEIDVRHPHHAEFRRTLLDVYTPRYGPEWEQFLDTATTYARIDPTHMFTFSAPPQTSPPSGHSAEERTAR